MALPNYEKRVNEMKNLLKYSTDEQKVGTWIDGKPIYKKTIIISNTALSAGENKIQHGISNLKDCIKNEVMKPGGIQLPYINLNSSNNLNTGTFVSGVTQTEIIIRIFNDSWGSHNNWYATLYYTKTTD